MKAGHSVLYGGFLNWGYPQFSSILFSNFPWNKPPIFGYPQFRKPPYTSPWLVYWIILVYIPITSDIPIIIYIYGYGSIPINTIFSGMNIHLPAILMFTRGTGFWPTAIWNCTQDSPIQNDETVTSTGIGVDLRPQDGPSNGDPKMGAVDGTYRPMTDHF